MYRRISPSLSLDYPFIPNPNTDVNNSCTHTQTLKVTQLRLKKPIPYYLIRIRKRLEEEELEPIESTPNNYELHTMMVSKQLRTN